MATVVVTFFLIVQIHVNKMDADYTKRRRESEKSRREKRWSMNSQRLEEIVAELMRPIIDVRRSFDTDLSALLEEYLTEAGLHALEASEEEGACVAPNFTEAALLLQQAASNYGRKVDYLYQHVLNVSDSLHTNTQESAAASSGAEGAEGAATPSSRRKRQRSCVEAEFARIELERSAAARREAGARPPPTLPRMYIELEPRALAAADAPLLDYAAEPIGLLADFQVTWRLQNGLLVDELEGRFGSCTTLRAVPLDELQAAIASAAPPSPPPIAPGTPPAASPAAPGTPPAAPPDALAAPPDAPAAPPEAPGAPPDAYSTPLPPPVKTNRKRRNDIDPENFLDVEVNLVMSPDLRQKLKEIEEFRIPEKWITRVVTNRKIRILSIRRRLKEMDIKLPNPDNCSFDISKTIVSEGFPGWAAAEAAAAAAGLAAAKRARRADESDDDGFFDQSSLGDSDDSANHHSVNTTTPAAPLDGTGAESAEWAAWRDGVVARAAAAETRGFNDVRAAARALLAAVRAHTAPDAAAAPDAAPAAPHFHSVLADVVHDPTDVSRMFLATLFLANAGNIEIIQGPPLTLNSFSVRFVSDDERRYCALAAPAPPPS